METQEYVILTPFLAPAGFLAPIMDFLGSAWAAACVGDILRAASTLGPSKGSEYRKTNNCQIYSTYILLFNDFKISFIPTLISFNNLAMYDTIKSIFSSPLYYSIFNNCFYTQKQKKRKSYFSYWYPFMDHIFMSVMKICYSNFSCHIT